MRIINSSNNIISSSYQSNQSNLSFTNSTSTKATLIPKDSSNSIATDAVRLSLSPEAKKYLQDLAAGKEQNNTTINKNDNINNSNQKNNTDTAQASKYQQSSEKNSELSDEQLKAVQELKVRDLHVKMHEQQHMAVAGAYAVGGPHYQFTIGPDGNSYAVGGEVQLDTGPVANNPEATIRKAQIIRQGALAPADPSGADRAVAAAATQMEAQARKELAQKSNQNNLTINQSSNQSRNKQNDSKIQDYKNFMNPTQIGQIINKSA